MSSQQEETAGAFVSVNCALHQSAWVHVEFQFLASGESLIEMTNFGTPACVVAFSENRQSFFY